jgi:protease IV
MANNSTKIIFGVFGMIFLMFLTAVIFLIFSFKINKNEIGGLESKKSSVAVIEINGPIMKSKKTIELLHEAEKKNKYKAIIIRIDSPGGAVGPTQEIFDEIVRIDKKIPVYASFGSVAASGGYYIGAAARKIYANRGTITGSIGVIMQFMDLSELFKLSKVKPEIVKSGKFKDLGNPSRKMRKKERQLLEASVSKVHEQFRQDIIKRRGKKIKGNLESLSQGQIFSGQEAFEHGLVDHLGGLYTLAKNIHDELKLEGDFREIIFIKKPKKSKLMNILDQLEEPEAMIKRVLLNLDSPVLMFK